METRAIDGLGSIGIEAGRAEHPGPNEAKIWTPNGETELFIHAVIVGVTRAGVTVLRERSVDGVIVSKVRYETSGSVRDSFDCGNTTYEVYGDVPSRFADVDEFLVQFVDSLDCVGRNGS
jgi:hypothetical protein